MKKIQILNKTEIIIKEYIHIFVGILFLIGIGNLTLNIEKIENAAKYTNKTRGIF